MKSYVYLAFSIALTVGCAYYCSYEKPSVFGMDFSFATSKLFVPVVGNLLVSVFLTLLTVFKSIYIGIINDQEKEHIMGSVKNDIFGLFFSIIYLKDAFSISAVFPIAVWIYLAYCAYLLDARMKTYIMTPLSTPRLIRLICGLLSHTALSFLWLVINVRQLLHYFPNYTPINMLMTSYSVTFTLQSVRMIQMMILIPFKNQNLITEHTFSVVSITITLIFNILQLTNYLFYMTINVDYDSAVDFLLGYPVFETFFTLKSIRNCIVNLRGFIKFQSSLSSDYAKPTHADLERNPDCVVCRDHNDEVTSVVMPCGHVFHEDCLKSWIMQKQTCPICNQSLFDFSQKDSHSNQHPLKTGMQEPSVQNAIDRIQQANMANMIEYCKAFNIPEDELDFWFMKVMEMQKNYTPTCENPTPDSVLLQSTIALMKQAVKGIMKDGSQYEVGKWQYEEGVPDIVSLDEQEDVPELIPQAVDDSIGSEVVLNADELPDGIQSSNMTGETIQASLSKRSSEELRSLSADEIRQRRLLYLSRSMSSQKDKEDEE